MTNSPGRQGLPEAERREKGNDRQIARACNQRGVVTMRPTHAQGKQSSSTLCRSESRLRD